MLTLFELDPIQLRHIKERQVLAIKKIFTSTRIGSEQDAMPLGEMTYSGLKKFVDALIFGAYEVFFGLEEKDLEIAFAALLEYSLRCSWRLYSNKEDQALVLFSETRSSFFHPASEFCNHRSGIYEDLPGVIRNIYVRIGYPSGATLFSDLSYLDSSFGLSKEEFSAHWGFSLPDEILENPSLVETIEEFGEYLTNSTFPLAYFKGEPDWALVKAACVECRSKHA